MTRGTEIMDHLLGLLAQIDPANGYYTDAGARAYRGRPDALSDAQADDFPAILVRTDGNAPGSSRPQQVQHQRAITVQGVTRAVGADYEPVLDQLGHDIFRALVPQGSRERLGGLATELTIDDCSYDHPEPGSDLAAVTYSITVTYVANYQQ